VVTNAVPLHHGPARPRLSTRRQLPDQVPAAIGARVKSWPVLDFVLAPGGNGY
jgi:hypothetical protein